MKRYLAIDIGASGGRHIVGWREDGELRTEEVNRFPNGTTEQGGYLIGDIGTLGYVTAMYFSWHDNRPAAIRQNFLLRFAHNNAIIMS